MPVCLRVCPARGFSFSALVFGHCCKGCAVCGEGVCRGDTCMPLALVVLGKQDWSLGALEPSRRELVGATVKDQKSDFGPTFVVLIPAV